MRMFRYATVANISGVAQQMRNGDFERASTVVSDRRKRKATNAAVPSRNGFFHQLPPSLQESLVLFTRKRVAEARCEGRKAMEEQEAEKLARREERVIALLNSAVEQYAHAKELFLAWQAGGAKSKQEVTDFIRGKPEAQQLEYLRKQIEMRVLGLGWSQFATRWSSQVDQRTGTVEHLQELLEEIIIEEMAQRRRKQLPEEAALPNQVRRNLGQLGTLDADALAMSQREVFSTEELERKSSIALQRRLEAGISDCVEDLNAGVNGGLAPAFDQALVGKRIEVLWKYYRQETNEPMLIWASGRVARVADGLTDKRSSRARTLLPAGALLWQWDADDEFDEAAGEQWLFLLPQKWNKQVLYGWRFDPREFGSTEATTPDPERRTLRQCTE